MEADSVSTLRANSPGYHPGWGGPEFTDWRDEQMSWKTTCYVGDWSFLWDVAFEGRDALKAFSDLSINGFSQFAVGQAKHVVQCSAEGKVIGDGILMRLGEQRFQAQGIPALHTAWAISQGGYDATFTPVGTFQLQVSGPTALAVCRSVTGEDLTDVKFMHFKNVTVADVEVHALRQGMAGEIGFEFHGPIESKGRVLDAILAAGEPHGIRRLGARTVMINHLEAAFPTGGWHYLKDSYSPSLEGSNQWIARNFDTYGLKPSLRGSFESTEIGDYLQSPITLGWAKSIRFDHEFVGRQALEREMAEPTRTRVTLEFNDQDVIDIYASLFGEGEAYDFLDVPHATRWVMWADAILDSTGATRGISGTPGYSAYFRKVITLAYIDVSLADPGTEVQVLWGNPGTPQKLIRAVVRPAPYKKDNRRADLVDVV